MAIDRDQSLMRQKLRIQTEAQLWGGMKPDRAGSPESNRAVLNGRAAEVFAGVTVPFGTWRPARLPVQEFGRRQRPTVRRRYVPVLTPLVAVVFDLVELLRRAFLWTWRALDGSR